MAVAVITLPLTIDYLGPERFGIWLTLSSLIGLVAFLDLGLGNGLLNAVTRSLALSKVHRARVEVSSVFAVLGLVAAGLGAAFLLTFAFIPWASIVAATSTLARSEAGPAVAIFALCFLVGLPMAVVNQVRLARQEGYFVHLFAAAGNVAAVLALLVVVNSRGGLPALVLALAVPPLIATGLNGFALFGGPASALRPSLGLAKREVSTRLLRSGFLFFVLQASIAVAVTSDALVLAHLLGPVAVADYGVVARLFLIPSGIAGALLAPLWPAYGDAIARGDHAWVDVTLHRSIVASVLLMAPAAGILVLAGPAIVSAWVGPTVTPDFGLILAYGIWMVLSTTGMAGAMFLNGAAQIRLQAAWAVAMAVVNLGLSLLLTPIVGESGVVWASVASYGLLVLFPMAIYVPVVLRRVHTGMLAIPVPARHRSEAT